MKFITGLTGLLLFFISVNSFAQCNNVTSAGTISGDEFICTNGYIGPIKSVTVAKGGSDSLRYRWSYSFNQVTWYVVAGANKNFYNPSNFYVQVTTYIRREATRKGCNTWLASNVVTKTIFVPKITYPGNYPMYCKGGSLLLTAPAGAGYKYQWFMNSGKINGATNQTFTVTQGNKYYAVNVNTGTCSSNSKQLYVTENLPLTPTITNIGKANFCSVSPLTLTVNNEGTGITYQWKDGGQPIGGPSLGKVENFNAGHAGSYTCDVANTCGTYETPVYNVKVSDLPYGEKGLIFPRGPLTSCKSITLSVDSPANYSAEVWYRDGKALNKLWNNVPTWQADSSGVYECMMYDVCHHPTISNPVYVTITQTCTAPGGILVSNLTSTSAKINWAPWHCAYSTQLRYRVSGTTTWVQVGITAPGSSRTLSSLAPGTTYDLALRTKCDSVMNNFSPWTSTQQFTTAVNCKSPAPVTATNLKKDRATITWATVPGAYSYKLRTRVQGTTSWTNRTFLAPTTVKVLTGLTANTTYEYQVQTICNASGTPASAWTPLQTFATLLRAEDEAMVMNEFTVYPNPTYGKLRVSSRSFGIRMGDELVITDVMGKVLQRTIITAPTSTLELPTSNLTPGVYFITLHSEQGNLTKKFVKQ